MLFVPPVKFLSLINKQDTVFVQILLLPQNMPDILPLELHNVSSVLSVANLVLMEILVFHVEIHLLLQEMPPNVNVKLMDSMMLT